MASLFDNRLRPAFEFWPAAVLFGSAVLLTTRGAAWFPVMPGLGHAVAVVFALLGARRAWQGFGILRYRRHVARLPHYALRADRLPVSRGRLFLGRGFRWDQRHSQRMIETLDPAARRWLSESWLRSAVRRFERRFESTPLLRHLAAATRAPSRWNPLRPPPAVGGNPCLHGVGFEDEDDVWMDLVDRTAHTLVLGTTRVGKTRLAELLIAQDILRGETVIVLDPKGDEDLLRRVVAESRRAGRLHDLHVFHLGRPEYSERYNPIGSFGRITEVASRVAAQLPGEGDAAAFREFAWRFVNVVAQALVALGRRPLYSELARHVADVEALLVEYYEHWLAREGPAGWRESVDALVASLSEKRAAAVTRGRDPRAVALVRFARGASLADPVADGLRIAFEYDRTYFDKLVAGLLPLLAKLTTGRIGSLLTPPYAADDRRPVLDWLHVVRQRGVVYVGLDALSDPEVAAAVGNAMFADLASLAGRLYKGGDAEGLPTVAGHVPAPICLHADEFNEIVGREFIPLLNKGGGAGLQITAYTQTVSDIEAAFADKARAGQVTGNLGTLIMMRVRNEETAKVLTTQLPKVRVYTKLIESRTTDDNHPETPTDFTSANADRLGEVEADLLQPSDLVQLPRGQAFALIGGGQLYKLRLPLARPEDSDGESLDALLAGIARATPSAEEDGDRDDGGVDTPSPEPGIAPWPA